MIKSFRDPQPRLQPDHETSIQNFLKWSQSPDAFSIGSGGSENEEKRKYIPFDKLRKKLTPRTVKDLLGALFDKGERSAPNVDVVISHYLRTFAILLCISQGSMICQFVSHRSLWDDRLPLTQEPSEFPLSTQGNIFAAFCQQQWAFCASTLEYNMSLYIGPNEILPINHKEKIDEGGSSITYKIVVDKGYDRLVPSSHTDSDHHHQNTYVLKTYQTKDAKEYYETELEAFRRLKQTPNIIGFYGGFVCQDTYNIILEYADFGNLDKYMELTPPPSTTQEKVIFWDRFLDVLSGLVAIHGEGEDNPDALQIMLGWHQDVNPFNILVKSHGAGSYECDFKLADLGLSHFEKHMSFLSNASTQDNFGTSTYGAPEARRGNEKLQKCNLLVKQNVDIWSLSCVLSEVATWVNKGWDHLVEYRNRRVQEMEQRIGKKEDCFHNGFEVLNAVQQSHDDIIDSHRANDPITSEVVGLIKDMMLCEEKHRPTAHFIYGKARRIIDNPEAKMKHAESPALAARSVSQRPTGTKNLPLKDPPNLPPSHERHGSGESKLVQRPYAGPGTWVPERSPSPEANGRAFGGSPRAGRKSHVYSDNYDETNKQGISNAASLPPLQPVSGQHGNSGRRYRGPLASHDRFDQRPDTHTIFPSTSPEEPGQRIYNNDPFSDLSELDPLAGLKQASRGHGMPNRTLPALSRSASGANQEEPGGGNARSYTSYSIPSKFPVGTAAAHLESNQHLSAPDPGVAAFGNRKVGTRLPEMSVQDGLTLKRFQRAFPRDDLFVELEARDHAFLWDNGESMKPHRDEAKTVIELLWAMVAKHDPDGPDLYITTDMKQLKPGTDSRMLQELDKRPAKDAPDMRHCFAQIIEKYQNRFGKRNFLSRMSHPKTTPAKGPRKLSLYVLTDGVWQTKTDLKQVIRTLVNHLNQNKLTNKQIGIQFIRFGNDRRGMQRLRKLDAELQLDLDIIDTTPANGNVWKMLLGSINETFDDDSDDEESDNEKETPHEYRNNDTVPVGKGKAKDLWG